MGAAPLPERGLISDGAKTFPLETDYSVLLVDSPHGGCLGWW